MIFVTKLSSNIYQAHDYSVVVTAVGIGNDYLNEEA